MFGSVGRASNTYKYQLTGTRVTLKKFKSGRFVINIRRGDVGRAYDEFVLTPEQKEKVKAYAVFNVECKPIG